MFLFSVVVFAIFIYGLFAEDPSLIISYGLCHIVQQKVTKTNSHKHKAKSYVLNSSPLLHLQNDLLLQLCCPDSEVEFCFASFPQALDDLLCVVSSC